MTDVTRILSELEHGDAESSEQLLPLVYDELRRLAALRVADEPRDLTLQATALVHEAYLRLVGPGTACDWSGRAHFFGAAAEAMRRILIERARRKLAEKRGGGQVSRKQYSEDCAVANDSPDYLLEMDEALERLAKSDSESAELVKLRVFAGLSAEEASSALGLSKRTAARRWTYARAWLLRELDRKEI